MPSTTFLVTPETSLDEAIKAGIRLWHEEAKIHSSGMDLETLWDQAEWTMDSVREEAEFNIIQNELKSWPTHTEGSEHLMSMSFKPTRAFQLFPMIFDDGFASAFWKSKAKFPYKGLLISALYFVEARNFWSDNNAFSSWASLTQAFYYLGMNSSFTAQESAIAAAKTRSSSISLELRDLVVRIANNLTSNSSIQPCAQASRQPQPSANF